MSQEKEPEGKEREEGKESLADLVDAIEDGDATNPEEIEDLLGLPQGGEGEEKGKEEGEGEEGEGEEEEGKEEEREGEEEERIEKDEKVEEQETPPIQEEKGAEEREEKAPVHEKPAAREQDKDTLEELRQEVLSLTQQLEEMKAGKKEGEEVGEGEGPKKYPMLEFMTEEEHEALLDDRSSVNKALTRVYARAMEDTLKKLPEVVDNLVAYQVGVAIKAYDFYKENPDLVPYQKYVGYVANKVQADNPDLPTEELFRLVEEEVRKKLNRPKSGRAPVGPAPARRTSGQRGSPAFANTPSARATRPDNRTELEKEIEELFS